MSSRCCFRTVEFEEELCLQPARLRAEGADKEGTGKEIQSEQDIYPKLTDSNKSPLVIVI